MANESLTSASVVVQQDTPQTLQETFIAETAVVAKDVPQTLQETFITETAAVHQSDVPMTMQETFIASTVVKGQIGESKRCVIVAGVGSTFNQLKSNTLWCDGAFSRVIVQPGINNSQVVI
jgi:hypothetical protein